VEQTLETNTHRYEKALKKGTLHINDQLKVVKETITKLSDCLIEEFDTMRDEVQRAIQGVCLRQGNLEARMQDAVGETVQSRITIETRFEGLRALVEDDFRKELERQRNLTASVMTDNRIRSAKIDQDLE